MLCHVLFEWLIAAIAAGTALPSAHRIEPIPVPAGSFIADLTARSDELFLTEGAIDDPNHRVIVSSSRSGTTWLPASPVSFSGTWRDLEQVISPDGRTIIFASNRPQDGETKPLDGFFGGKVQRGRGGNLWRVTRSDAGWSRPERLPDAVNANSSVFAPALTSDGTLYFMKTSDPGPHFHLYMTKLVDGEYRSAVPAPFGDIRYSEFDPTVAPDNSFAIFGSSRPPAKAGTSDLFISFNRNGTWTPAEDMGASVNPNGDATEPRLSVDGHTLYFSSNHAIWSVDITPWLDENVKSN